jgi:anti-anti-sigma factor
MNVTTEQNESKTLVTIQGRVDTTTAAQFQADLEPLMEGDSLDIDIDCSELEYTSSQGLRVFLMLQKSVNKNGGALVLRNMRPEVKEVFDITGFSNIIKII